MRKTVDRLISWTGLIMAAVLLVAGGLLTWASTFVADNVYEQLSAQNITMPAEGALETQEQRDALLQYAGQPMTDGDQAKAYADHYILDHMNASSDGRTYSQVSSEYMKLSQDPAADKAEVEKLAGLRQSLFMGSTLRGLLLYGYAFDTIGEIAGIAAIVCWVAAGALLVLALLGLRHAKNAQDALPGTAPVREPVPTA